MKGFELFSFFAVFIISTFSVAQLATVQKNFLTRQFRSVVLKLFYFDFINQKVMMKGNKRNTGLYLHAQNN